MSQSLLLSKYILTNLPKVTPELNLTRSISISCALNGKRNFRNIYLGNKRGQKLFKKLRSQGKVPDMPIETEVQATGYFYGNRYVHIPEMVPDIIVPDLTDCELKPYVSYRVLNVEEEPSTSKDLFDVVYRPKIEKDFREGKLKEDGTPTEASPEEKMTADEAYIKARMTGSDLFSERIPKQWEFLDKKLL